MWVTRRGAMGLGSAGAALLTWIALGPTRAAARDWGADIVEPLVGGRLVESDRVALAAPGEFPVGTTVPLDVEVDCAMTEQDHVRALRIFAPRNPIVEVVGFGFEPGLSVPIVSTRIRLAGPQYVVAVAEMGDGSLLTAKRFVEVGTNGCPGH